MEAIITPLVSNGLVLIIGGFLWEGYKFFSPDIKRFFQKKIDAKNAFYENLDPILKAAGELLGKIESLAKEDFATFIRPEKSNSENPEHNQIYICYLFAQFWAQFEYLRLESQYVSFSENLKGVQLLKFIDTFESRQYRILDRSYQRIIGESLMTSDKQKFRILTLKEFIDRNNDPSSSLKEWTNHLHSFLANTDDKDKRQSILVFGIIILALINHFDPKHKVVRKRETYENKLSRKSKQKIKYHLLDIYLPFIKKSEIYYKKKPAGRPFLFWKKS